LLQRGIPKAVITQVLIQTVEALDKEPLPTLTKQ
jgi:hypothetical protein